MNEFKMNHFKFLPTFPSIKFLHGQNNLIITKIIRKSAPFSKEKMRRIICVQV